MASEASRRILLIVAVLLSMVFLVFRGLKLADVSSTWVNMLLKSLPVVVMAMIGLTTPLEGKDAKSATVRHVYGNRVGLGLMMSALGDAALEAPNGFLLGLAMFLIAHLCYIASFQIDSSEVAPPRRQSFVWMRRFSMLGWASTVAMIYQFFRPAIPDDLSIPVMFYVATIGTMVYKATVRRCPESGSESYWYGAVGAVLFMISDFLLAYNKFVEPLESASLIVIMIYYMGQVAICSSTIVSSAFIKQYEVRLEKAKQQVAQKATNNGVAAGKKATASSKKKQGAKKRR